MVSMPAIHVRDVPEPVMAALRERAARHQHSMQQELHQILAAAAAEPLAAQAVEPLVLTTVHTKGTSTWGRGEIYDDTER